MIFRDVLLVDTNKAIEYVDITDDVANIINKSGIKDGVVHVFLTAATAGLMLSDYDKFLLEDIRNHFERTIDKERVYAFPANAHAHLRASMLKQSISIPVSEQLPYLGEFQRLFLWEFDEKARQREVVITVNF